MSAADGLKALMDRMMASPLVMIHHFGARDREAIRRLLPDHLGYLIEIERRGVLFGSGPLSGDGIPEMEGMTLLQGVDIDAARELWRDEPFFRAGLRQARYAIWTLNEGAPRFRLNLSSSSASMPAVAS